MTNEKLTKSQKRMREIVKKLQHYFATYDQQSGYDTYSDRILIDDVLYGLGMILDEKEYSFALGFDKFKKKLWEHLGAAREQDLGDQIYALLVRRGYAQHEAHLIASGPGCVSDCVQKGYPEIDCPAHGSRSNEPEGSSDAQDAARYRWLKEYMCESGEKFNEVAFDIAHDKPKEDWDVAIDTQLQSRTL